MEDVRISKYVRLMYSTDAESKKRYPDYMDRKREMAIQAGFEFDETFSEDVENMLIGKDEDVNKEIIDYVISLGSPDMIRYVAFQQLLATQGAQSMSETDEKKIKTVVDNINKLSEDLKQLEFNLFAGTDNSLRKSLYSSQVNKLRLRPEHVAKMIADKNLIIKDIYYGN